MTISSDAAGTLRSRLQGELLLPGEPAYDESRSIWNAMIDKRPGMIARCLGVADVMTGVEFAREHDLPLSIKGGGHNISGLSLCDQGLMLDMSLMRGVWIDRKAEIARAQAGCLLGDVDRETQVHGLAAVLGFVSKTGIAGLTLGGGFGYLSRKYGWTSDNVISMEMVTTDGRLVRASEEENSDLFWGLRGGGGNFGVITGIEYNLYPVGPEIMAGAVAWRGEDAPGVLEMYRRLLTEIPPEFTCVAVLRPAPPAPWLPVEIHGKPIVALFVCHTGSVEQGERDVAPIKSFGSPIGDVLQPRPYLSQQSLLDATQPSGRRYYWKSEYVPGLEPALVEKAIDHAEKITSPHSAILLFPLDGALNELHEGHSAVGNRDAKMVFNIAGSWEDSAEDDRHIEWARSAWRDMRSHSTGGTYINFLTEEETGDRIQAAFGGNYERLVEIKTKWDPDNLLRNNKNIAPAAV